MNYHIRMLNRVFLLILLSAAFLNAQDLFEAKVYVQGSDNDEPMFIYTNSEDTVEGKIILSQYYHYTNGELFASEELFLDEEKRWEKHVADFPLLDERSEMLRSGDKVNLTFTKKDRTKTRTQNLETPLLFGPVQQSFLRENLDILKSGEPVYLYIPVAEYGRLIQFKIEKTEDVPYDEPGTLAVVMNTKSFILSWFIGDTYFIIDKDDGTIREIHGSSALKQQVNGKWEYIDVDIFFEYL